MVSPPVNAIRPPQRAGLAARQAAERGILPEFKATPMQCLEQGDRLFEKGYVTEEDLAEYHDITMRFHHAIVEASANEAVATALARNSQMPFASVSALAVDREHLQKEYRRFSFAHMQHHDVVEAISLGHGARAESIMRTSTVRPSDGLLNSAWQTRYLYDSLLFVERNLQSHLVMDGTNYTKSLRIESHSRISRS
nr:FCD domain-containing protein [Pseudomonas viridiflava]